MAKMFETHRLLIHRKLFAFLGGLFVCLASAGSAAAQSYEAMSCDDLWYARNAIYAAKGYCFETDRARQVFGPRCFPPYGDLSSSEQSQVNLIRRVERSKGCSSGGGSPAPQPIPQPAPGGDYSQMGCDQLWYARNAIYAAKGYCFKTARAREVFGPRCFPPYGELNGNERRRVSEIKQWEARRGCR